MKRVAQFEKVSNDQWCVASYHSDIVAEIDYDEIQLPIRKTAGSAGYDFLAPCDITIRGRETVLIPTGIKCQIDEGYVLELYPRSSLGFKYKLALCNTVGIIDSDYYNNESNEGHIMIKMTNGSEKPIHIACGEGFAQGIFKEFFITKDDIATSKRIGGIGSTNK